MDEIPTNRVNKVKNIPIPTFIHFVNLGDSISERKIIKAGIAKVKDAANNFIGVFNIFCPSNSPATFWGTYSSK
ncbi:MAG: hypothetical protein JST43_08525 [Bacteroidetes bacterium]|nr:hypothetical protein [Bacteroidota bacterium]MBS1541440.1 hypothetical protein [Bacteroidota bacterium]